MAGIYIHIPFCKQACYYCDFHFSTNQDLKGELCRAISTELTLRKDYLEGEVIESIYFGGGTPSVLADEELSLILDQIRKLFSLSDNPEVTLEANPDDLQNEKLQSLVDLGINRLSIGIQSFDNAVLKSLNRSHTAEQARQCVEEARNIGISNLNIDIIYSIPGQSLSSLADTLSQAALLKPPHISAYSLTIEEKTVFGKWAKAGKFKELENSQSADQFETVMKFLEQAGYEQYEISNYSLNGFRSRHNSSYWRQKKYLGLGPSAHSFNRFSRQHNVANNSIYIKNIKAGIIPAEVEILSRENKINEYIFTSLRTSGGCDLSYLMSTYDFDLMVENKIGVQKFLQEGLTEIHGSTLFLTQRGKLLADSIAAEFFI